jgi:drug/metabolite transporter (DMT)-like permease
MIPDRSRWQPMLLALALAGICMAAVEFLDPSELIKTMLALVVFVAWFTGACAMVGYVRWFFASELAQAKRDKADAAERERK